MGLARRYSWAASVILCASSFRTEELHTVVALRLCTNAWCRLSHEDCACSKQSNSCDDKTSNQDFVHASPPVWDGCVGGYMALNLDDGMVANHG
jgi:hypothetical protein